MRPLSEQAVRSMLDMLDAHDVRVVHLHTDAAAAYERRGVRFPRRLSQWFLKRIYAVTVSYLTTRQRPPAVHHPRGRGRCSTTP